MTSQTEILSNGSKWAGEQPDPIEALFARLETDPLDRSFEAYGNFIIADHASGVSFFGNFHTYSHVFNIQTTDPDLIARLAAAIRKNQQRTDYLAQPDEAERRRLEETARQERDRSRDEERERRLRAELKSLSRRRAA